MSTQEKISRLVSQLPPQYQEVMLGYVERLYEEYTHPDEARAKREQENAINDVILDRIIAQRVNPKPGTPLRSLVEELRQQYGR